MNEEDDLEGGGEEGVSQGWLMTYADLMSLLMSFFVLLLAFSEMDVLKFKQLAGSLKEAFGVQREIKVKETPKGTSIIAQEFSPGRPEPTPIVELRQQTTDESRENLDLGDMVPRELVDEQLELEELKARLREHLKRLLEQELAKLRELLEEEIRAGRIEVNAEGEQIVIRLLEKGSFASGSAELEARFIPILLKIGRVLRDSPGTVIVSGHTDDVPINTPQFPSNWVLSAARAATVVHHLTRYAGVPGDRIEIRAYAEYRPVADNDSESGRARNRRVEIAIEYGALLEVDNETLHEAREVTNDG
ncbi:MAG: flagellar motor protein MotB [Gammaproteobacteria bacterium]|nr:MAG: flagellar motor protein MotB [Gammaproteobacteria bacterium]